MIYSIHGKSVPFPGECGIYKSVLRGISMDYAAMEPELLVRTINSLSKKDAIKAVTALREVADEQSKWEHTPQNIGYPILMQRPGPTPISDVKEFIGNTKRFTDDVLKALLEE